MKSITFECEVITPMFLAGADGKTPELRPPSIKGAMRFWWRAVNGHLSLAELKKKEAEIFGNQEKRSCFDIMIVKNISKSDIYNTVYSEIGASIKVSKKGKKYVDSRNASKKGIAYLFYSTWIDGENIREAIKPSTNFSLKFTFHKDKYIYEIIKSFKTLVYFGGLGSRSRRGAGSFRVKDVDNTVLKKDFGNFNSIDDFRDFLNDNFIFESGTINDFSILKGAQVYFFNSKSNWIEALETIGKPFYEYRNANKSKLTETPNFGFPILHKMNKITMIAGKNEKNERGKEKLILLERRSSPIIFKIIKLNDNNFLPMLIWLKGRLVPEGYEIMDKKQTYKSKPKEEIIRIFFTQKLKKVNADIIL